jgi:hypothetical protein
MAAAKKAKDAASGQRLLSARLTHTNDANEAGSALPRAMGVLTAASAGAKDRAGNAPRGDVTRDASLMSALATLAVQRLHADGFLCKMWYSENRGLIATTGMGPQVSKHIDAIGEDGFATPRRVMLIYTATRRVKCVSSPGPFGACAPLGVGRETR